MTAGTQRFRSRMPLNFLRKIQDAEFPLRVEEPGEVDCVAVLIAAELVEGVLSSPASRSTPDGDPEVAIVERITPQGRAELARLGSGLRPD